MYTFTYNPLRLLTCFDLLQIILREFISNKHIQNTEKLYVNFSVKFPVDLKKIGTRSLNELYAKENI
jgi:hypothetical protein